MKKERVIKAMMGVFILLFVLLIGFACNKKEEEDKEFMDIMTNTSCYYVEGIMESFYTDGRKQNEFKVYYKSPSQIKVILNMVDSEESQIILKNDKGIYILIPNINKNFKIQSDWPTNASYPYLLTSLTKDIANATDPIVTEDDKTKTYELDTHLYKDAIANKQKIVISKDTNLPVEVLIYDSQGNLYIRVVFTKIDLEATIDDKEFVVDDTMTTIRQNKDNFPKYESREIRYPLYCPEGVALSKENTTSSSDGLEALSIMTFAGTYGFTIVQEYKNDTETISFSQESGEIACLLGVPVIIKTSGVQTIYEGIEYTIASSDLPVNEMLNILASYMTIVEEK